MSYEDEEYDEGLDVIYQQMLIEKFLDELAMEDK